MFTVAKREPFTLGQILESEFMEPYELSKKDLACLLDEPYNKVARIVNNSQCADQEFCEKLASLFGNTPKFWMNLQDKHELWKKIYGNKNP